jgi:hypothetical protein
MRPLAKSTPRRRNWKSALNSDKKVDGQNERNSHVHAAYEVG